MDTSEIIGGYKTHLERNLSRLTVKNYISDINHFLSWIANTYPHINSLDLLTKNEFDNYISSHGGAITPQNLRDTRAFEKLSQKSFKRHISSLKSFSVYLLQEKLITEDPFMESVSEKTFDPWGISEFKTYLDANKAGHLTIKYYINDVKAYKKWCEETNLDTIFKSEGLPCLSEDLVNEYAKRLKTTLFLSPKSINRKLSSLRRYSRFLQVKIDETKIISFPLHPEDEVKIQELVTPVTEQHYSRFPPVRLIQKSIQPYIALETKVSDAISSRLITARLTSALKPQNKQMRADSIIKGMNVKNISKEFYAPHDMSLSSLPFSQKLLHHVKYTRPKWYKKYHTYPFVHYTHFAVLIIFGLFASSFLYNQTIGRAAAQNQSASSYAISRTFTFQGKLADKKGEPVTDSSDLRLALYSAPTGSGSAQMWEELQASIEPDENGIFSIIVGSANSIPEEFFANNAPLYLGITVNDSPELTPRKQIGSAYAQNANKLNGLSLITDSDKQSNVVLALDARGDLYIGGEADHTFQANGEFTLSGKTLVLSTNPGSSGNVVLSPEGNGKIDLQKPLINSLGRVSVEGGLVVAATTSASPALSVKQDSAGDLINASTAGSSKFVVNNQGLITKGIWGGEVLGTQYGGFGADISASGAGELLYSTSSKTYGHLIAGKTGDCLISNGKTAPVWSACGFLSQLNGAVSLTNNSLDFLLGGVSSGSAKFGFINISSNNPIFKIGGSLSFSADNGIEALDKDLKLGGNSTKNIILNTSGNVGLKNTNPQRTFDVNGNWGGNVDYVTDGANTQTINRSTKALIYDLEKNTGSADNSTTTTYNIVGLPNVDGTIGYIYAKVQKDTTPNPQTQTITLQINGTHISTISTDGNATPDTRIKHFTITRSNNAWHLVGEAGTSDTADLAEWTNFTGSKPRQGDLVSISENGALEKSSSPYDKRLAGVISTKPNITIGKQDDASVRLALSGRVPVIVTNINGPIISGDSITSSPFPGVGMKLSRSSATVGKTLEPFNPTISKCTESRSFNDISWPADDGKNSLTPCFKVKVSNLEPILQETILHIYGLTYSDYIYIGKVMLLSDLSWSNSDDLITSLDNTTISQDAYIPPLEMSLSAMLTELQEIHPVVKAGGKTVETITAFAGSSIGKLNAGTIHAISIGAQNLIASRGVIGNLTVKTLRVTDSLTVNGLSLKEYVAEQFNGQKEISSPLARVNILKTNSIQPNGSKKVVIELAQASDSALVVRNTTTGRDAVILDTSGTVTAANASLSGTLSASNIDTKNATISGTLRTNNLIADTISGLDDRVASITSHLIANSRPSQNIPSVAFDPTSQASISANFGTFYEGLLSLGASTFGNLSVMDQLSVGTTLALSPNSINTLGIDLEIQPLRQGGISFLAGAVRISIDGRLIVSEDAEFKKNVKIEGTLSAHILSPLPNGDVKVGLPESTTHNSEFRIQNSSESAVLAVNTKGDLQASGSGTFSKLNFNIVGQAYASGVNQATATGSAGTAILKGNTAELTILNPNVTENSLIYITPAKETQNQVLYLMRQTAQEGPALRNGATTGSFTVGLSQKAAQDILFNWLIVN